MKRIFVIASMMLASAIAHAADLPMKARAAPVYASPSWQGLYVGGQLGYGWSREDVTITGTDTIGAAVVATGAIPGSLSPNADGFMGGVHVGYNWQAGQMVYGVEASFDFSGIDGSAGQNLTLAPLGIPLGLSTTVNTELEWLGTLTARAGVVVGDRLLVFGRGGLAYGDVSYSVTHTLTAPAPFGRTVGGTFSDTRFGWTVGAGAEYAISRNLTARVTYDYIDLGSGDVAHGTSFGPGAPVNFNASHDFTFHRVGVGASWRF